MSLEDREGGRTLSLRGKEEGGRRERGGEMTGQRQPPREEGEETAVGPALALPSSEAVLRSRC